jgi:bacterioferritin-associated ferredoxin
MLMQTTISIECGQELETKVTMHEEILRCHSKRLDQLYAKAKPLREQCGKCQRLCKQVARFIFPEMTAKQFEDASSEHDVRTQTRSDIFAMRIEGSIMP